MVKVDTVFADAQKMEAAARVTELRAEQERLRRVRSLKQAYGINFYNPHWKQDKFHVAGDKVGRYVRTGNRGGKTKCGAAEDVAWCLGGRTWYRNSFDVLDGDRNVVRHHVGGQNHELVTKGIPAHPVKGLLLVNDWDKATEIFTNRQGSYENWGELFKLIPRDALGRPHVSRGGHVDQIPVKRLTEFGGGESVLYVDTVESYKHANMSAESSYWDFFHLDEPCPRDMFVAHKRGLVDRNGKFWVKCTPLTEMWINDEFRPPNLHVVENAADGLEFNKLAEGGGSRFMITWSIYDNPYNSREAIAEFEAGLNREERECRLHGLPLNMAGLIYKEFVYDMHVLSDIPKGWDNYHMPPKHYTIRVWMDYHIRLPQAVLFFATGPQGQVYVYDELFSENLIDPVAKAIVEKTKGYFVADYEIDKLAVIPHPVTEESIVDELAKYDLYFEPATKDLALGINKVRERLSERDPFGNATIFFSPNLRETLFEFARYVYDPRKNRPMDENDHMMENLYRAILNGLSYIEPPDDHEYPRKPYVVPVQQNLLDLQPSFYEP
jgi:hypothetical protein